MPFIKIKEAKGDVTIGIMSLFKKKEKLFSLKLNKPGSSHSGAHGSFGSVTEWQNKHLYSLSSSTMANAVSVTIRVETPTIPDGRNILKLKTIHVLLVVVTL